MAGKNLDNVKTTSFLAESTDLDGVLTVKHGIRIDGRLSGSINSDSVVYLGEKAHVAANITAEALISNGRVEGDVTIRDNVHISLPGSLKGSVETAQLIVEKGVYFEGHCKMNNGKAD